MEKIEIEKYIKTFKDEQGNIRGYGIVGNLVELVEKINNTNKEIEHIKGELLKELVHIVEFNSAISASGTDKFILVPDPLAEYGEELIEGFKKRFTKEEIANMSNEEFKQNEESIIHQIREE